MKQIIAIGGGGFGRETTDFKLEKYLLSQTKKNQPKVCFLPQASHEDAEYIVRFLDAFLKLGAIPSWISLFGRVDPLWKQHLLNQDLIYVGGGNTKSMIAIWKGWELDQALFDAYNKGIILAGVSAGAICWFEQGITDSIYPLGIINGLNILPGSFCPHFDSEKERQDFFKNKVNSKEIVEGVALDDYTAAHYINGKLSYVIKTMMDKKAYSIQENNVIEIMAKLVT